MEKRPRKVQRTSTTGSGSGSGKNAKASSRRISALRSTPPSAPGSGPQVGEGPQAVTDKTTDRQLVPSIQIPLSTDAASFDSEKLHSDALYHELEGLPGGAAKSDRTLKARELAPYHHLGIQGSLDHKIYTHDYGHDNEKFRLLSLWSVCSDRGLDLEGQHIARVAKDQTVENYDHLISSPEALLNKVREDLEPLLSSLFTKSELYFLPWTSLHRVLSTDTVLRLLRILNKTPGHGKRRRDGPLEKLAETIAPPLMTLGAGRGVNGQFRRTFATLILSKRESMIFAFVNAGLDDKELLDVPFEGLRAAPGRFRHLFEGWGARDIKHFKKYRWEVSPTFFAAKRESPPVPATATATGSGASVDGNVTFKRVRYKLRSTEEVLPFEGSDRDDISGGFAEVRFFKLHEDQQDLPRFTRREKDNDIAVKTFKNETKGTRDQFEAYANEVYVMERLASIDSPHMAKLLATIEVPRAVSHRERSDYHLVLEAADGTIEKLWKSNEWQDYLSQGISRAELAKWIARQCYGLADALWKFHEFPKGDGDLSDKTHGLHCDIKPDNILHYKDWKIDMAANPQGTVHPVLGVLQLGDFGLGSFHSTGSVENHRVVGDFLDYAAPETDFLLTHSPAADIWHLGCLLVDFATWLLDGPDGYAKFATERLTTGLRGYRCRFATFTPASNASPNQNDHTHVKVNPRVLQQATYLCKHPDSSEFVRELCHLGVNYMLVMRDTNQTQKHVEYSRNPKLVADRLTSKQVAEILGGLIAKEDVFFEPSATDVLPFEDVAWKRSYLELRYSVQQLRQISQKVKSGLDPTVAGLVEPGVAVVEEPRE